ncbi:hypothetical protein TNCV_1561241 [Trichonephila clavipes]|nr:hypothetical protein TNCV_1561241 [Trichonephila clavipes]
MLLVETILRQTKNTLIRALTGEWEKLPQQLLDNVVQSMVMTCWNVASHSTVDISRTDTFLWVPADFLDALFHFSVRRSNEHFFLSDVFTAFVFSRTINILYSNV